jgi:HAD superfamily hydrolase (TIGR01549 family)
MRSGSKAPGLPGTSTRFIYFDLDDTLLDHGSAERAALRDLAHELLGFDEDSPIVAEIQRAYRVRNIELWGEYSAGRIGKDQLRHRRFEEISDLYSGPHSWRELDSFYMSRYADHWSPVDGALGVFERVAQRVPVGIITNGFADTQHAKLDRFPLLRRLSRSVVISEEVGYLKPDGRLFEHAEQATREPGENILYVGDSLRSDVRGALAAGWQAAWYSSAELPEDLAGRVFVFDQWSDFEESLVA